MSLHHKKANKKANKNSKSQFSIYFQILDEINTIVKNAKDGASHYDGKSNPNHFELENFS